jgi:hypothetical protein
MQALLVTLLATVGFATVFWIVRALLRSVFGAKPVDPMGVALISAGISLMALRAVVLAIPFLILGLVMLVRQKGSSANRPKPQTSKVRSKHLEMSLDHETGAIDGRILTGQREGQVLSDLGLDDLLAYYEDVQADEETIKLLETFLDAAHADWRNEYHKRAAPESETSYVSKALSQVEAYEVLGLAEGCSEEDIRRAYRRLIKRVHPDSGGSAALLAKVTEARDKLLGERE